MCFFTGQVGDKERGVGRISDLSMLFISILCILFTAIYLSLCHCMNALCLVYECEKIFTGQSDIDE